MKLIGLGRDPRFPLGQPFNVSDAEGALIKAEGLAIDPGLVPWSPAKIVDLGVIDFAQVFAHGPQTLYEMADGEFLRAIKWTDTDYEAPRELGGHPNFGMPLPLGTLYPGVGTRKSFGWYSFSSMIDTDSTGAYYLRDTDGMVAGRTQSLVASATGRT